MGLRERDKNIIFGMGVVLLWGVLVLFFLKPNNPDNDMYFLAATGRHILKHGIPETNPFSIDSGLRMVVQQWAGCIIDYLVLSEWGNRGVLLLACLYMVAETVAVMLYARLFTKNRLVVFVALVFTVPAFGAFYNTRGSIVTASVIILETCCLFQHSRTGSNRYLIPLPFFSVFMINWQAAAWWMLFVYLVPFFMPGSIYVLGTGVCRHYRENRGHYTPLLLAALLMAAGGMANPYGTDGMLYLVRSIGSMDPHVGEHNLPAACFPPMATAIVFFAALVCYASLEKGAVDVRMVCLCIGSVMLGISMNRNIWYAAMALPCFTLLIDRFVSLPVWKQLFPAGLPFPRRKVFHGAVVYLCAMVLCVYGMAVFGHSCSASSGQDDNALTPLSSVGYLETLGGKEGVTILSDFNNGGFYEWNGYRVFLDARPEVYSRAVNGQKDIFREYIKIMDGTADYGKLLGEYGFSHVFAGFGTPLYYYMENCPEYIPVAGREGIYRFYERAQWGG